MNGQQSQGQGLSPIYLSAVARFSGTEGPSCELMRNTLGEIIRDCIPKSRVISCQEVLQNGTDQSIKYSAK